MEKSKPSAELFRQNNILIISPQAWGSMLLSKHHYAITLAEMGNQVYFLGPPDKKLEAGTISLEPLPGQMNLFLLRYNLFFPYTLKFRFRPLFNWLMKQQSRRLKKQLPAIDILFDFDIAGLFPDSRLFEPGLTVFAPYDQFTQLTAKKANLVISVSAGILEHCQAMPAPKLLLNHGLQKAFAEQASRLLHAGLKIAPTEKIQAGYAGNLFMPFIDRLALLNIIHQNPEVDFVFWGSYSVGHNNIGGDQGPAAVAFIEKLASLPNVNLRGPVSSDALAHEMQACHLFLLAYDAAAYQGEASNSHKILEYASTGKCIVSSYIEHFKDSQGILLMPDGPDNSRLPELFRQALSQLGKYNALPDQEKRIKFALDNTYAAQVQKIRLALTSLQQTEKI